MIWTQITIPLAMVLKVKIFESLEETRKTRPISDGTVFLVFWLCLTQLLQRCSICLSPAIIERSFVKGTMIIVDLLCKNQQRATWQAKTQSDKLRFKQQYLKVTQPWVVKQIREPKDRVYIQHLMDEVMYIQNSNEKYELPKLENIPKTIAQIEKPNKEEAIKNIRTCFSV